MNKGRSAAFRPSLFTEPRVPLASGFPSSNWKWVLNRLRAGAERERTELKIVDRLDPYVLVPMAWRPNPAARGAIPMARCPDSRHTGPHFIMTWNPDPPAIPVNPVALNPNMRPTWSDTDDFVPRWWRGFTDNNSARRGRRHDGFVGSACTTARQPGPYSR